MTQYSHPPRAVIFDFGNVVAFFDYTIACERLAAHLPGRGGGELLAQARNAGLGPLVLLYETGQIDDTTFSQRAVNLLGLENLLDPQLFADAWQDIFSLNTEVARIIAELDNNGTTLILGSNTNPLHARQFRHQFADLLTRFDHLVLSFEIGHAKPSPAFFQACLQRAGLPPSQCLFIDDLPENIESARQCGLDSILYQNPQALLSALSARKLFVNSSILSTH